MSTSIRFFAAALRVVGHAGHARADVQQDDHPRLLVRHLPRLSPAAGTRAHSSAYTVIAEQRQRERDVPPGGARVETYMNPTNTPRARTATPVNTSHLAAFRLPASASEVGRALRLERVHAVVRDEPRHDRARRSPDASPRPTAGRSRAPRVDARAGTAAGIPTARDDLEHDASELAAPAPSRRHSDTSDPCRRLRHTPRSCRPRTRASVPRRPTRAPRRPSPTRSWGGCAAGRATRYSTRASAANEQTTRDQREQD
jgi:hypothetical protein